MSGFWSENGDDGGFGGLMVCCGSRDEPDEPKPGDVCKLISLRQYDNELDTDWSEMAVGSSIPSKGASGPPSGSPAPVAGPLPGYCGTVSCLDAHYPRSLLGHYF